MLLLPYLQAAARGGARAPPRAAAPRTIGASRVHGVGAWPWRVAAPSYADGARISRGMSAGGDVIAWATGVAVVLWPSRGVDLPATVCCRSQVWTCYLVDDRRSAVVRL